MENSQHLNLAHRLAEGFAQFPQVEAVTMAGSLTSGAAADTASDIDLYVYTTSLIPLEARLALVEQSGGASRANMNLTYWDLGDEWFDAPTGIEVDVMYWEPAWVEGLLDRVIRQHQASLGYTTAHWNTVRASQSLFDRNGWFARLQQGCRVPYPAELRRAIIDTNFPLLRDLIPSYTHQIEKAVRRGDLVSVNHRLAALLASYFDILFAFNEVLHPGEKRQLDAAARLCPRLPVNMTEQVNTVLRLAGTADKALLAEVNRLVNGLEALLGKA